MMRTFLNVPRSQVKNSPLAKMNREQVGEELRLGGEHLHGCLPHPAPRIHAEHDSRHEMRHPLDNRMLRLVNVEIVVCDRFG
jgi:hypothetical protein